MNWKILIGIGVVITFAYGAFAVMTPSTTTKTMGVVDGMYQLPDGLQMEERSETPSTPEEGVLDLYFKNDGSLNFLNSTGEEKTAVFSTGSGTTISGTEGDEAGRILCLMSDKTIGTCSSTETCTCS